MFKRTYIYNITLNENSIKYDYELYFDGVFKKCIIFVYHNFSKKTYEYQNELNLIDHFGEDFIIDENKVINNINLFIDEINNNYNKKIT